jgi:hypothetical protein
VHSLHVGDNEQVRRPAGALRGYDEGATAGAPAMAGRSAPASA